MVRWYLFGRHESAFSSVFAIMAQSGRARMPDQTMRTAVCVVGHLRTAACNARRRGVGLTPAQSTRTNLLDQLGNHDVFAVFDLPDPSSAREHALGDSARALQHTLAMLQPVRLLFDSSLAMQQAAYDEHVCHNGSPRPRHYHPSAFFQARKLQLCWRMVLARERELNMSYTHVVRTRPDLRFLRRLDLAALFRPRCFTRKGHRGCKPAPAGDAEVCVGLHHGANRPNAPQNACVAPCSGITEPASLVGASLVGLRSYSPWLFFNDMFFVVARAHAEPLFSYDQQLAVTKSQLAPKALLGCSNQSVVSLAQQPAWMASWLRVRSDGLHRKCPKPIASVLKPKLAQAEMRCSCDGRALAPGVSPPGNECALALSLASRLHRFGSQNLRAVLLDQPTTVQLLKFSDVDRADCSYGRQIYACGESKVYNGLPSNETCKVEYTLVSCIAHTGERPLCMPWCADHEGQWSGKCAMRACAACSPCPPPSNPGGGHGEQAAHARIATDHPPVATEFSEYRQRSQNSVAVGLIAVAVAIGVIRVRASVSS